MPFCTNCGKEIERDDKFCPECRHPIKMRKASLSVITAPISPEQDYPSWYIPPYDPHKNTPIKDEKHGVIDASGKDSPQSRSPETLKGPTPKSPGGIIPPSDTSLQSAPNWCKGKDAIIGTVREPGFDLPKLLFKLERTDNRGNIFDILMAKVVLKDFDQITSSGDKVVITGKKDKNGVFVVKKMYNLTTKTIVKNPSLLNKLVLPLAILMFLSGYAFVDQSGTSGVGAGLLLLSIPVGIVGLLLFQR